ncbi:MAG: RdgB/HAM1 family non-canonical purine NTP pyrophosphatase [Bacillota bacterium]|nr:RdgB/HAM1 family non-canonical purine NTP pyrophosphatase [Bacillota bacterium]
MRLILATHNSGKLREYRALLAGLPLEVVSLADCGSDEVPPEDGSSFAENALQKARHAHRLFPQDWALADDSGLVVDALGGRPGIHSSRYAGETSSYEVKIGHLLAELADAASPSRAARFVCVIALIAPDGREWTVDGELEGEIGHSPRGTEGFGYDPIFWLPEIAMSSGELDPVYKNRISHRGRANQKVRVLLDRMLDGNGLPGQPHPVL